MIVNQTVIEKLKSFINRDKFSVHAWEDRGLIPSDDTISSSLQDFFNGCANNLIEATGSNFNQKQLKKILKDWLESIDSSDFDTEEREFICDYFHELSRIVSVDFKDNLNNWLYGKTLMTLFKLTSFLKGKNKVIQTLIQDCTKCNSRLETFIIKKQEGIPDHCWTIVQCTSCNEFNLISIGPDVKEYRNGNYKEIEILPKSEHTLEQANSRLEQLKFFRKN